MDCPLFYLDPASPTPLYNADKYCWCAESSLAWFTYIPRGECLQRHLCLFLCFSRVWFCAHIQLLSTRRIAEDKSQFGKVVITNMCRVLQTVPTRLAVNIRTRAIKSFNTAQR